MFKINERILMETNEYQGQMVEENIIPKMKYYKHSNLLNDSTYLYSTDENEKKNNTNLNGIVNICVLNVNTNGKNPFFLFLLNNKLNNYEFFQLKLKISDFSEKISSIKNYLQKEIYNSVYEFRTLICYRNETYIIMEMKTNATILEDMLLLDEIINSKKKYGTDVNAKVIDFITAYLELFLLYDEENKPLENPSVLYSSREHTGVQNTSTDSLLSCKGDAFSIVGPFFLFY